MFPSEACNFFGIGRALSPRVITLELHIVVIVQNQTWLVNRWASHLALHGLNTFFVPHVIAAKNARIICKILVRVIVRKAKLVRPTSYYAINSLSAQ